VPRQSEAATALWIHRCSTQSKTIKGGRAQRYLIVGNYIEHSDRSPACGCLAKEIDSLQTRSVRSTLAVAMNNSVTSFRSGSIPVRFVPLCRLQSMQARARLTSHRFRMSPWNDVFDVKRGQRNHPDADGNTRKRFGRAPRTWSWSANPII